MIIVLLGPTASGKTARAVSLARFLDGEIISADSRQVYRDMNIGTGKDLEEYGSVKYHLIDICQAGEKYNLHRYIKDFHIALKSILEDEKTPIICGGTGMYLENAISGIRLPDVPENQTLRQDLQHLSLAQLTDILKQYKVLHNRTDIDTPKRAIRAIEIEEYYKIHPELADALRKETATPLECLIIGIDIPRDIRRQKISLRLHERIEKGMIDEVKHLLDNGISPEDLIYYGLEYKFLTLYAIGKIDYNEMVKQLETAIHQFAKRQMTWFRGMERRGFKIHWLPYDMNEKEFLETVNNLLSNKNV